MERSQMAGPVAQLGARFHGMEEVVSSNLTRSTKNQRLYANNGMIRVQLEIGTEPYFGPETIRPCQNVPSREKWFVTRSDRTPHRTVARVTETAVL
jgi:hypothetical protein